MDILIIGLVGVGVLYIIKNPQVLQGQPAGAAQVQCADGTLVATAEDCPETIAAKHVQMEQLNRQMVNVQK